MSQRGRKWEAPVKIGCRLAPNALVKSALTEGLADPENRVTQAHITLYHRWAHSGAGVLITGNIIVDRRYLERAGNVSIDLECSHTYDSSQRKMLQAWSAAAKAGGALLLGQLSHAGLKVQQAIVDVTVGPSAREMGVIPEGSRARERSHQMLPAVARAATVDDLDLYVKKWAHAARVLEEKNVRIDEYGGSLESRARLLVRVLRAVRGAVSPDFILAIKIHCSDLSDKGFTWSECANVIRILDRECLVDLIEFSGEIGRALRAQRGVVVGDQAPCELEIPDVLRHTWFCDRVHAIRSAIPNVEIPMCVTGGFLSAEQIDQALSHGVAEMVGLGRAFCLAPDDVAARLKEGSASSLAVFRDAPQDFSNITWLFHNFLCLGEGAPLDKQVTIAAADARQTEYELKWATAYHATRRDGTMSKL